MAAKNPIHTVQELRSLSSEPRIQIIKSLNQNHVHSGAERYRPPETKHVVLNLPAPDMVEPIGVEPTTS
jgi:hypothetical protein